MEIESGRMHCTRSPAATQMTIFHEKKNGFSWSNRFAFLRSIGLLTGQVTFDKFSVASSSPLLHNGIEPRERKLQSNQPVLGFIENKKDDLNKKWQHVSAIKRLVYPIPTLWGSFR